MGWKNFFIVLLSGLLWLSPGFAAQNFKPLLPEEAFVFSTQVVAPNKILAKWTIAPGYYLYQHRFDFSFTPMVKADIQYPSSLLKFTGEKQYQVYGGNLVIPIVLNEKINQVTMDVSYQGCSEHGFCYPMVKKSVSLQLTNDQNQSSNGITSNQLNQLVKDQNKVNAALIMHDNIALLLLLFVGLGLLLSFTPCVLPMIPILTSIIVGHKKPLNTKKALFLSITYVLGTALTYSIAGVLAALLGSSLQIWLQTPAFILVGAMAFIILALSLFGLFELRMPQTLTNMLASAHMGKRGGAYVGVFIMGVFSALMVSPCVTAPLVGVLMYIAATGNVLLGGTALFALGIGMGIPLIAIGLSAGKWMPRHGPWMETIKKSFGVLMLGMAVWLGSRVITPTINPATASHFIVVKSLPELQKQLEYAKQQQKPVIVDFYADWCESCIQMEKQVFSSKQVQTVLTNFVLVRADLSKTTMDDELLLKKYEVIAPPTVLFFNQTGNEDNNLRIVGAVDENEFMNRLTSFSNAYCEKKIKC